MPKSGPQGAAHTCPWGRCQGRLWSPYLELSLILHKDRIGVTQCGKKFEEIGFGIGLCLGKDAILDGRFADLILSILTDKCFKVDIGLGKYAGIALVHVGFFIIESRDKNLGRW